MKKLIPIFLLALQTLLLPPAQATNIKISDLPLGVADSTGLTDALPYVDTTAGITKRLYLSKLIFLPSMQSTFAPVANPTFTGTVTAPAFVGPLSGNVTGNVSGSAGSFTGSLVGDVTGTQGATVVSTVAGSTAANVHAAELLANAATNLNTASAIVKRDGSGNFTAGTITASLTGTASGNTSYTANQYGVVTSGSANTMSVIAPNSSTVYPLISGGVSAAPAWGLLTATGGGTGLSSYALGDVLYSSATNTLSALSGNTTTTKKFLTQTGNGSASAAPAWATIANTDLSGITNTQLSGSAAITNANLATMASSSSTVGTVKGNISGSSATPSDIVLTSANTNSSAVYRDSSGNFSAGTITAALTGNASTATSATSATTATNLAGGAGGQIPYQSSAGTTALLSNGSAGQFLKSNGTTLAPSWAAPTITLTAPTVQKFTSGSGTYTTPANVLYIKVRMVGGGGGGEGSGAAGAGGQGGDGGDSTFGSSLLTAGKGGGTSGNNIGGAGGTVTVNSPAIDCGSFIGAVGGGGGYNGNSNAGSLGGGGGNTPFGGASPTTGVNIAGATAKANTGSGGGGGSYTDGTTSRWGGGGGGAAGYICAIIGSPSATYSYAIGAAGTAGTAGAGGFAGGAGAAGVIIVEEYYQ